MKIIIRKLAVFIAVFALGLQLNGQTIDVNLVSDSTNSYCPTPVEANVFAYGTTTVYTNGTPLTVNMNYGNGFDTTFNIQTFQNSFYLQSQGTYTSAGSYKVRVIVSGPGGVVDTAYSQYPIVVGDTCGNIKGSIFTDANGNCTKDGADRKLKYAYVKASIGGSPVQFGFTDANGDFSMDVPTGNTYDIEVAGNSFSYHCPSSGKYTVSTFPSTGNNFAIDCNSSNDLAIYQYSRGFVPGRSSYVSICVGNRGCELSNGTVCVVLPSGVTYDSANTSTDSVVGNNIYYTATSIDDYQCVRFYFTADTTLVLGDTVCVDAKVVSSVTDLDTTNNVNNRCYRVRSSYDPNEKISNQAREIEAGQELSYSIYFQNTGNDTAFNIFIRDTIDANLDIESINITSASHPMTVKLIGNAIKFQFDDINLVDSNANEPLSHGYVHYAIKAKPSLTVGTIIENTAFIYFDYNAPIVTNTTENEVVQPVGINSVEASRIALYPNPVSSMLNINYDGVHANYDYFVYDITGVLVYSATASSSHEVINTEKWAKGIYILEVKEGNLRSTSKFIKQ